MRETKGERVNERDKGRETEFMRETKGERQSL